MKSKEVLKLLQISRPTLCHWRQEGKIRTEQYPNGYFNYNDDDVFRLANISTDRSAVIYARVSTKAQKSQLDTQIDTIRKFANENGFKIDHVYRDIASGLSFDRGEFQELLHEVIGYKVKKVFISEKDRLTRVSFDMWKELFSEFHCDIIVLNESDDEDKEIFSDIISLLHCFAMRMYSARRKKKLTLIEEDLTNAPDL